MHTHGRTLILAFDGTANEFNHAVSLSISQTIQNLTCRVVEHQRHKVMLCSGMYRYPPVDSHSFLAQSKTTMTDKWFTTKPALGRTPIQASVVESNNGLLRPQISLSLGTWTPISCLVTNSLWKTTFLGIPWSCSASRECILFLFFMFN